MTEQRIEIDPAGEMPELLTFVSDYWTAKRGGREIPRRADIVPSELKPRLSDILLVDVVDGGRDFRYRLVGSRLHRSFSGNPTGKLMSETLLNFGRETVRLTIDTYAMVIAKRRPVRIRTPGSAYAQDLKTVNAILAPLSDDGVNVNMIFGAFQFVWNRAMTAAVARADDAEELEMKKVLGSRL
jgi:hypothetical protein